MINRHYDPFFTEYLIEVEVNFAGLKVVSVSATQSLFYYDNNVVD